MNILDCLNKPNKTLVSFEILPPVKGDTINSIYQSIDPLTEFSPTFISVTYHREEIVFKKRPDGLIEKNIVRKRPGTVGISSAIQNKYNIEVIPHLICRGFNREETENALIDLNYLGIHNVFAVRGDNNPAESFFPEKEDTHTHADELVSQIVNLNKGIYNDTLLENATPTNFTIGVAAYPEKHIESPNIHTELKYLKQKVKAGANYIITQMFFDNAGYFRFVDLCRNEGIEVPIIPGLKPISTKKQLTVIPQTFFVDLPQELVLEVEKCKTEQEVKQVGIEWTIFQAKELIHYGVPDLHFFSMGKSDNIRHILRAIL
jgi:methylenetetrahydrofolate reductase (NADPH)